MVLNDREIRALLKQGELGLTPFDDRLVQPASIDLRLDGFARVIGASAKEISLRDVGHTDLYETVSLPAEGYAILPGGCLIGQTMEHMKIPNTCGALLAQRSSLMRLGIQVSSSWINPGYAGNLPILITNTTSRSIRIFSGIPFCQLVLLRLSGRPDVTYAEKPDAKYHDERQFHPSQVGRDVKRWIAPSVRLARPEQANELTTELTTVESTDDKLR